MSNIGFRGNDIFGESGLYGLKEIILYETENLGNDCILDTMNEKYGCNGIDECISYIENHFGCDANNLYSLWLCDTVADVVDNYCMLYTKGEVVYISAYEIPDDAIIISDIDREGKFYVSSQPFRYIIDRVVTI